MLSDLCNAYFFCLAECLSMCIQIQFILHLLVLLIGNPQRPDQYFVWQAILYTIHICIFPSNKNEYERDSLL